MELICDGCNEKIKEGSRIFICPECRKITCEKCMEKEEKNKS